MKIYCIPLLFMLAGATTIAQTTDFNTLVHPIEYKARDFGEYLVQLAWINYPENAIKQVEYRQAQDQLRLVKKDWLKDFQLTINLNEANLANPPELPNQLYNSSGKIVLDENKQPIPLGSFLYNKEGKPVQLRASGGNAFYPRFNFGLNINFGNLMAQTNKNRVAQHDVKIAEHKINEQKLNIRADVYTRYQQYRYARDILKARTQVEQDAYSNFVLIKELYSKDERSFEDYNEASSAYFQARESRIKAEADVMFAKIKIEQIVGLRWEQIQHPQKDLD